VVIDDDRPPLSWQQFHRAGRCGLGNDRLLPERPTPREPHRMDCRRPRQRTLRKRPSSASAAMSRRIVASEAPGIFITSCTVTRPALTALRMMRMAFPLVQSALFSEMIPESAGPSQS